MSGEIRANSPTTAPGARSMPVIGFLNGGSSDGYVVQVAGFHQGLKEAGYIDGQNVKIEYRWADDLYDRLPAMAIDLVRHEVTAIVANTPAVRPAQAATKTIPIVFITGADPVAVWACRQPKPARR